MRKICWVLLLVLGLWLSPAKAEEVPTPHNSNPVDMLTGELWQKSSPEEKRAFIFGVDSAVTVEYYVDHKRKEIKEKQKKERRNFRSNLSPFERGWMDGLKDLPRRDLIKMVDEWYVEHVDQINRPVLDVIWYEVISPRLPKKSAK